MAFTDKMMIMEFKGRVPAEAHRLNVCGSSQDLGIDRDPDPSSSQYRTIEHSHLPSKEGEANLSKLSQVQIHKPSRAGNLQTYRRTVPCEASKKSSTLEKVGSWLWKGEKRISIWIWTVKCRFRQRQQQYQGDDAAYNSIFGELVFRLYFLYYIGEDNNSEQEKG